MEVIYTEEEYQIAIQAAYDKGRWENPNIHEVLIANYYKQQKIDQSLRESELAMKCMDIDQIAALTKELDETKDKYIALFETIMNRNA